MALIYRNSWVRISAASAAVFLASAFFAPEKARASCGDYVSVGGGESGSHGQSQTQQPSKSRCGQCPQNPAEPGKAPCNGPHCSGQDPAPAPAPTVVERIQDNWAYFWITLQIAAEGGQAFGGGLETLLPSHHALGIFHPPRI